LHTKDDTVSYKQGIDSVRRRYVQLHQRYFATVLLEAFTFGTLGVSVSVSVSVSISHLLQNTFALCYYVPFWWHDVVVVVVVATWAFATAPTW
jgi:hypothetical protein